MTAEGRSSPLALRLAAAFVVVAVVAVSVFAALIVVSTDAQTRRLLEREHTHAAQAAAAAAGAAYATAGSWTEADLDVAAAIAASAEARVVVTDGDGQVVAAPTDQLAEMMSAMHGVTTLDQPRGWPVTTAVELDGQPVGAVTLTFPLTHDGPADQLRTALWRTAVVGTILATLVALVVAVVVARRLIRPVTALTAAAGRLAAGQSDARADVTAPGELGELAATFDDMADRLETAGRLRRKVMADVAHELRTPLAVLQGETEAMLDGIVTPDAAALTSLHDEVTRLSRLVGDLETLAAADAARLTMHPRPVDLAAVAERATELVRTTASEAGIQVTVRGDAAEVEADPDRLHQVVLNLLSNAIKFTPAGGQVTVTTRGLGHEAVLEVDDTGPGLAADEAAHVFDRFWQGTAGGRTGGSGIGLAVAAELIAAHDGSITATTNPAGGARFTISLPARPSADGPTSAPTGRAQVG